MTRCRHSAVRKGRDGLRPIGGVYRVYFAARTSTFSMTGGTARRSPALAMSAAATRPERWALRPASSGNASKIPKVFGPSLIAYQTRVAGSSWTIARPPFKKASTSASLPGFASRRTRRPTLIMSSSSESPPIENARLPVQYSEIDLPGADGPIVSSTHDPRDLVDVVEVVGRPGGEKLAEAHPAELGMRP